MNYLLFSNYIRDALKQKKWSEVEFARNLGHSTHKTVQSWIDGHAVAHVDDWDKVSALLDVTPNEIMAACLIERHPEMEPFLRTNTLNPAGSKFPLRGDDYLVATKQHPRFDVSDPHDEPERLPKPAPPVVRKRSAAAR